MPEPAPKLLLFKATPDHISPFGSSTLSWNVALPDGFTATLNNVRVSSTGEEVVQPASTSTYALAALHGGTTDALGFVTVSVDTSQCVQQVAQDVVNLKDLGEDVLAVFTQGFSDNGYKLLGELPLPVSVTLGLIAFDFKGTLPAYAVNLEVKGSFGLTVDRTTDQLAPIDESSQVNCSVNTLLWVTMFGAGASAGGVLGSIFGPIGAAIGAAVGAVAGVVTVVVIINKVSNATKAGMPAIFQYIVQKVIAPWFTEPAGMAMAAVSIVPAPAPAPALPPDGNITVMYCPKPSGGTAGGVGVLPNPRAR